MWFSVCECGEQTLRGNLEVKLSERDTDGSRMAKDSKGIGDD